MKVLATLILYALFVAGCGAIVYGLLLWSEPLAWVVGGLMMAVMAVLTVRANLKGAKA